MKTNFSAKTAKSFKVFATAEYTNVYAVMKCLQGCFASVHAKDIADCIKSTKELLKQDEIKADKNAVKQLKAEIASLKAQYERAKGYKVDAEVKKSIKAAKADGITIKSFSLDYIIKNLTGTDYVQDGKVMKKSKGEWVVIEKWTIAKALEMVRRANKAERAAKEC